MIRDKHVLILTASVTTGISARKARSACSTTAAPPLGSAPFSAPSRRWTAPRCQAVFGPGDVTGYETYPSHDCPLCRSKNRLDALVNGYGYSKL